MKKIPHSADVVEQAFKEYRFWRSMYYSHDDADVDHINEGKQSPPDVVETLKIADARLDAAGKLITDILQRDLAWRGE